MTIPATPRIKDPVGRQFQVTPAGELYTVIDTTKGRDMCPPAILWEANELARELNSALTRGRNALCIALGSGT